MANNAFQDSSPFLMDESGNLTPAPIDPDVRFMGLAPAIPPTNAVLSINAEENLVNLYGGAIRCVLPSTFEDVSHVRQVPDNQEVWIDTQHQLCVIFELLEYEHSFEQLGVPAIEEHAAVVRHIQEDIAETSQAQHSVVDSIGFAAELPQALVPSLQTYPQAVLSARHAVSQRPGSLEIDAVQLMMLNVRLRDVDTDVVITMYMTHHHTTIPSNQAVNSSAVLEMMSPLPVAAMLSATEQLTDQPEVVRRGLAAFRKMCGTLEIVDWSLFAA